MKCFLLLLSFTIIQASNAQKDYLQELELTETSFSLQAQVFGLRHAFMQHMDSSTKGLNKQGFNSLYTTWKNRPDASGPTLVWMPALLMTSRNGEFGVSVGPYYTLTPGSSFVQNTGYYYTIWERKQGQKSWLMNFDTGIKIKYDSSVKGRPEMVQKRTYLIEKHNIQLT